MTVLEAFEVMSSAWGLDQYDLNGSTVDEARRTLRNAGWVCDPNTVGLAFIKRAAA